MKYLIFSDYIKKTSVAKKTLLPFEKKYFMHNLLVFTLSFFTCCSLFGQQAEHCGTAALNATHLHENAALQINFEQIQAKIKAKTREIEANPLSIEHQIITIPVVVHVIFKGSVENITDAQIFSQLDILNADFRRQNADRTNTPIDFQAVTADMEIEFCLAKTDPDGNPSTGITRTQTNYDNIGSLIASNSRPRIFYSNLGGEDAWDTERYLNIWVAKIGNGILGMASFPGAAPPEEDGVVVDPRYFGSVGWAALNAPHDKGRTCTHEIGHFFNLKHIWGDDEDNCSLDDEVGDTPSQRFPYVGCPAFPQLSCGKRSMFMNFMDYTDDACQNLFTQGQKARLWAALLTARSGLMTPNSFCTVATDNPHESSEALIIYPNPTNVELQFDWAFDGGADVHIVVFSSDGKKVLENNLIANKLDVSHLPAGLYYLRCQQSNKVYTKHFGKL